ncbi:MOSC domain-containing protein [Nocardioides daphniae]|uniref:MOSC domain-containing protein n=1 Tax=Nocardioides daphniae TaxID=402297 RepID=UPI001EE8C0AE|nr:MOSC domain-containing protein [Nocardioides daphniae]
MSSPRVVAVCRDGEHRFSKTPVEAIALVAGRGVEGDAHAGEHVQHRSRVRRDPLQPNLRQVHLIHAELFDEARAAGHELSPGDLGENVTTGGLDLLALPVGTLLDLGGPVVRLTGLRNPCAQINTFRPGLLKVVLARPTAPRSASLPPRPPTPGSPRRPRWSARPA